MLSLFQTTVLVLSVHSSCKDAKIPLNGVNGSTKETGIALKSFLLLFDEVMVVMVRKNNCHVVIHSWMQYKAQATNVQLNRHHNI
jgi:hypothetical protein